MPALSDLKDNMVISFEDMADMVSKAAFSPPPADAIGHPLHWEGTAHLRVDEARVKRVLFD